MTKRRLQWSALLILTVCVAALFGPARSWIGQLVLSRGLHPNLSASAFKVHWRKSVVEASELQWGAVLQDRNFGLAARHAWFAIEPVGLVDRHLHLPKVILQDARLYLDDVHARPKFESNVWQQHLAAKLTELDWYELHPQFESLAATQELTTAWNSRTQRWIGRSQTILQQSQLISREIESHENPLREEEELRARLVRLGKLVDEQELLLAQFDGVTNIFDAEAKRLERLQKQDQQRISEISQDGDLLPNTLQQQSRLSVELAKDFANQAWSQFAPYAEVVDRLGQASLPAPGKAYDVNLRANRRDNTVLDLTDVTASGKFEFFGARAPFSATGHWTLSQDEATFNENLVFDWSYDYQPAHAGVAVRLHHDSLKSAASQLRLTVRQGPGNSEYQALEAHEGPSDLPALEAELTSLRGQLHGTMALRVTSMELLSSKSPANAFDWIAQNNDPINIQVEGSWMRPSFTLSGDTPQWLLLTIRRQMEKELDTAVSSASTKLDAEFTKGLAQLRRRVEEAVGIGRSQSEGHRRQLLTMQEGLQRKLDDITGDSVARRNTYFLRK